MAVSLCRRREPGAEGKPGHGGRDVAVRPPSHGVTRPLGDLSFGLARSIAVARLQQWLRTNWPQAMYLQVQLDALLIRAENLGSVVRGGLCLSVPVVDGAMKISV